MSGEMDMVYDLRQELGALVRLVECPFDREAKKREALLDACERARGVLAKADAMLDAQTPERAP